LCGRLIREVRLDAWKFDIKRLTPKTLGARRALLVSARLVFYGEPPRA
jgi:hypothetical protein